MTGSPGELAAFLRARRATVPPGAVGLPSTGRRRSPGLRREEVAALAGVSADYYTRLEQGRHTQPSPGVLHALAEALRMTPDERGHLFVLAGHHESAALPPAGREVSATVRGLVDRSEPLPAYVLDHRMDVLHWNAAATRLLVDFAAVPPRRRNTVVLTFLDPGMRSRWADPVHAMDEAVAYLRANATRYPRDARLTALVGALTAASPEFARAWARHGVRTKRSGQKLFDHPAVGRLLFDVDVLDDPAAAHQLVVLRPADERTSERWAQLSGPAPLRAVPSA